MRGRSHRCSSSAARCSSRRAALAPRRRREASGEGEVVGRLGVGDAIHDVILVGGKVDLGDVRVGEDPRLAEEKVARSGRGETSFFSEGGGEDVDGKGATKLGNVTVGVPAGIAVSVKFGNEFR